MGPAVAVTHCRTLQRLWREDGLLYSSDQYSKMSVRQVDGEGGDAQSCGPIDTGLGSDLERSAWAVRDTSPNLPLV